MEPDTASGTTHSAPDPENSATLADYLSLARLDHVTKQIFVVPGFVLALLLRGAVTKFSAWQVTLGILTSICIASANYVINEYLDREFDRFHPVKCQRRAVQREMSYAIIVFEWLALLAVGLTAARLASATLFFVGCLFALQGVVYNVAPIRTKDRPFLDVISESINNPIRLTIGWAMVDPSTLPPSSIILSYWFGGAFLMAAKRYSEYREILAARGRELLIRYRASLAAYSEDSLLISCFVYGMLSTFFLAIFLIKYRVEYVLLMPPTIILFGYYLAVAMRLHSVAQHPEKLFTDSHLMQLIALFIVIWIVATWVDIPGVEYFTGQRYISLG